MIRASGVAILLCAALPSGMACFSEGGSSKGRPASGPDRPAVEPVSPRSTGKTIFDVPDAGPPPGGNPVEVNPRQITNPDALERPVPDFEPQPDPLTKPNRPTTKPARPKR